MHRALEISEASATPYISKSSGISIKQKNNIIIARLRYPNRAVTKTNWLFQSLPHLLKFSGYATDQYEKSLEASLKCYGARPHIQ